MAPSRLKGTRSVPLRYSGRSVRERSDHARDDDRHPRFGSPEPCFRSPRAVPKFVRRYADADAATTGIGARRHGDTAGTRGHRQPTQSTLPPSVRKDEDTTGRGVVDDLGPVPQICRNC